MINWDAVRFLDCVICEDDCAPFTLERGETYQSYKSVCGYCMWKFKVHVKQRKAARHAANTRTGITVPLVKLDDELLFANWLAKNLRVIANGDKKMRYGKRKRRASLKSTAEGQRYKRQLRAEKKKININKYYDFITRRREELIEEYSK